MGQDPGQAHLASVKRCTTTLYCSTTRARPPALSDELESRW